MRVDVSDVNEYPPRFPADSVRASVAEEEAVGTEVKKEQEAKMQKKKLKLAIISK